MRWNNLQSGRVDLRLAGAVGNSQNPDPVLTAGLALEDSEAARSLSDPERLPKDVRGSRIHLFVFHLKIEYSINSLRLSCSGFRSYSPDSGCLSSTSTHHPGTLVSSLNIFKLN